MLVKVIIRIEHFFPFVHYLCISLLPRYQLMQWGSIKKPFLSVWCSSFHYNQWPRCLFPAYPTLLVPKISSSRELMVIYVPSKSISRNLAIFQKNVNLLLHQGILRLMELVNDGKHMKSVVSFYVCVWEVMTSAMHLSDQVNLMF